MRAHLAGIVAALAQKHGGKWPGGTGPESLSTRSGGLLKSLQDGVRVAGSSFSDVTGSLSGVDYLFIQEYGGDLRPKYTQYLAVPLPAALGSNGVPLKENPRDWSGTFVQTSKRGNLLIFRRDGTEIIPLYALKTAVRVPPRLGARKIAADRMPYFTSQVLDAVLAGFKP